MFHNGVQIGGIPQRMRNHDRFCLVRNRIFDLIGLDIIRSQFNIQKYRDQIILEDRVEGCGKSAGRGNDFITGV